MGEFASLEFYWLSRVVRWGKNGSRITRGVTSRELYERLMQRAPDLTEENDGFVSGET